jgi:hypothetical protein
MAAKRLKSDCFAPFDVMISFGEYSIPFSLFSLSAIACKSGAIPSTAVYFVNPPSRAFLASSFIGVGVSKSGSPAPKFKTSFPSSLSLLASVEIAIVMVTESLVVFLR